MQGAMLVIDPGAERLPQGRAGCARPYNELPIMHFLCPH